MCALRENRQTSKICSSDHSKQRSSYMYFVHYKYHTFIILPESEMVKIEFALNLTKL